MNSFGGIEGLQTLGAVHGILGAILVTSLNRETRFIAFLLWIISNLSLIFLFCLMKAWPLLAMQGFYFATSIVGAWKNRPVKKDLFPDA